MIRTTRLVTECVCKNCAIIHLLGQTFNGQRCCKQPSPMRIGERMIVEYSKTNAEDRAEMLEQYNKK